jgi:hypothetical protein
MAYTPSQHTVTNKALGIGQATPTDARSYYFQSDIFVYRPYQDTAEVLAYLDTAQKRTGQFSIFINDGTLDSTTGEFTGGVVHEWWFKDGVADGDLVEKLAGGGGGGSFSVSVVDDF